MFNTAIYGHAPLRWNMFVILLFKKIILVKKTLQPAPKPVGVRHTYQSRFINSFSTLCIFLCVFLLTMRRVLFLVVFVFRVQS